MTSPPTDRYLLALADAAKVARGASLPIRGEHRYGQAVLREQIAAGIEALVPPDQGTVKV